MTPPLRVGVAGVGSLGFHHARILRDLPEVQMVGVYDLRPGRAAEVGSALGVAAVPSLDDLLARAQALVVAVPTTAHEAVAVEALARGLDVFVEKPLASSIEGADRIIAAAQDGGALVQVGHVERFNSAIVAARDYLEQPLFIESHRLAPFGPRGTDVAVVLDLMIHDVDLVRSLVGTPIREIAATGVPVLTGSIDIANARLEFEGGAVANLTASRVSMKRMRKIRLWQRTGYLSLDLARGTGEFLRLKQGLPAVADVTGAESSLTTSLVDLVERITFAGDGVEPLVRELESFRDAALRRSPVPVSGADGRAALELSLSIEERIESHVVDTRAAPA